MSGGGGGSSRAHFRSSTGCCICGTKSSSSRFTASQRYTEHFSACFGSQTASRGGDLCNACVLCVKRWLQRGKQQGLFAQVIDSKRGPGPKHMKEITKRARRREARAAAQLVTTRSSSNQASLHQQPAVSSCRLFSGQAFSGHSEGATLTRAAAARQLEAASSVAERELFKSSPAFPTAHNSNSTRQPNDGAVGGLLFCTGCGYCFASKYHAYDCCLVDATRPVRANAFHKGSGGLTRLWVPSEEGAELSANSEFRQPPPPASSSHGRVHTCATGHLFAHSSPCPRLLASEHSSSSSSTTTTASSTPRRYNRRVLLHPVKMTDSDEVNCLLREIMERNSLAINFDPREMHMAVQRELRLRNRTVNASGTTGSESTSLSGCYSSGGQASEFSSVDSGSVEECSKLRSGGGSRWRCNKCKSSSDWLLTNQSTARSLRRS